MGWDSQLHGFQYLLNCLKAKPARTMLVTGAVIVDKSQEGICSMVHWLACAALSAWSEDTHFLSFISMDETKGLSKFPLNALLLPSSWADLSQPFSCLDPHELEDAEIHTGGGEGVTSWERMTLSLYPSLQPYGDDIFLILWAISGYTNIE